MSALVLQLQAEALDANTRIADLLRKAKVVAMKLDLDDFMEWIENELNGYKDNSRLPSYRTITARVKAFNPYRGWMPVIFEDHDFERELSRCHVMQAIGSLEDVTIRSKNGAGYLAFPIPGYAQAILAKGMGFETEFQMQFDASSASGILDAVRTKVLDWSLSLEKAGVLGEGMTFNVKEREAAKAMSSGNVYHIQNVGVLGDVAHSSVTANQSANYTNGELSELRGAIEQIASALSQLDGGIRAGVTPAIEDIRAELDQPAPNPSKLRSALASIRTTCEGAAGNLIASGIIGLVSKFL